MKGQYLIFGGLTGWWYQKVTRKVFITEHEPTKRILGLADIENSKLCLRHTMNPTFLPKSVKILCHGYSCVHVYSLSYHLVNKLMSYSTLLLTQMALQQGNRRPTLLILALQMCDQIRLGFISITIFHTYFKFIENLGYCNSTTCHWIIAKICSWHNWSCTRFDNDFFIRFCWV